MNNNNSISRVMRLASTQRVSLSDLGDTTHEPKPKVVDRFMKLGKIRFY